MRTWLSSILLFATGAFAVASGCGNPDVVNNGNGFTADASVGGDTGSGATGGSFSIGEGGANGTGCPSTCEELNANCGFVTDTKCGGVVQCGSTCPAGQVCGGAAPNRCGTGGGTQPDGGTTCVAPTCADLNANCGAVTDTKCGGDPIMCGNCPDGQTCGVGGPSTCGAGDGGTCVVDPKTTCAGLKYNCGQIADNCGNLLNCGATADPTACPTAGDTCNQHVCSQAPACVVNPGTTCAGRGYTCGEAADNCGHLLNCNPGGATTVACPIPGQTCGGGVTAGVCGCKGACAQIPTCNPGVTTTITGKVYDPAGRNPLYHVLVYIANDPTDPALKTFPTGITCDVCGASAAGSPLISTPGAVDPPAGEYTGVDGSFTLKNAPVGAVTLVIQLGRWRRTFPITVANSCAPNAIVDKTLLMPATKAQGNIPLMAMVTGNADSLECVLRKMGIDKSEFTDPAQGGRVQFYAGTGNAGQTIDAATPTQDKLFTVTAGQPAINNYDMTILSCQGAAYPNLTDPNQGALRAYADGGGRVFTTHYSYTWLDNNKPTPSTVGVTDNWNEVATWHVDENDRANTAVGIIDKVSNPKGNAFQGWLEAVNASTPGSGTANVIVIRHDTDLISPTPGKTQQWLYRNGDDARVCLVQTGQNPVKCTNDATCTALGSLCNVSGEACTTNANCSPKVCQARNTTACNNNNDCIVGNRDRGPCVAVTNTCLPQGCNANNYTGEETPLHFTFNTPVNLKEDLTKTPPAVQCGRVLFSDFHVEDANENGETFPTECGKGVARTPANANGTCTADANCTGVCNTTSHTCPWGTACTTNAQCASTCSGGVCLDPMNPQEKLLEFMIFDLGSCVPPAQACVPAKTCPAGQNCGYAPDGCGGLVSCGVCPTGEQCGVGNPAVPNVCGKVTCTPTACPGTQQCGYASDGCNGATLCGTCPTGQSCTNGKCGSVTCTPKTCTDQNIECGHAGDQCGNEIDCPACPANEQCIAGKCQPLTCVPLTCADQGFACGQAADGCGNMIASCGTCPPGDLCIAGKCTPVN